MPDNPQHSPDPRFRVWCERIKQCVGHSPCPEFETLYEATFTMLSRYVYRITRDQEATADIMQDVFLTVWEKRKELDCSRSLKAFLYAIARNRALNHNRRTKKTVSPSMEERTDPTPNVDQTMAERECDELLKAHLDKSIQELPERQREAFELVRSEGLTHEETAEVMGISKYVVKEHVGNAMKTLALRMRAFKATSGCT